nr:hypothetical protein [Tanacetum cinerariifolium]
MEVIGYGRVQG